MGRLFTRIYLHFLFVLVLMGIASTVIGSLAFRGPVLHGFAARIATHTARLVADRIGDPARLEHLVDHLATEFDVDLTVRDPSGKVLASAGPVQPRPTDRDLVHMKRGPVIISRWRNFCAATRILDNQNGASLGVLEIAPRRRFGGISFTRPLMGLAAVLLIVGLATAPLARRLSRPVDKLIEATRRFGDGDLAYRIPLPPWCREGSHARAHRHDQMTTLLLAWNDMAARVEKLIGGHRELLANVSHELRSPLARLRVALELLPRAGDGEARIKEIEADLGELDRLIEDVLTTSRLDASGFQVRREEVELEPLFKGLTERAAHDPILAGKEVIARGAEGMRVRADGTLLKRALWNLLENAGKYGAPPIALSVQRVEANVIFAVEDAGPGIPDGEREDVLRPFYRGDKARTPQAPGAASGGFGLGLTLARQIADAHAGSLRLESVHPDGRGLRVVLTLRET